MQQASRTRLQSRKDVIHLELTTVVAVFFFSGCEVKLKFREKKLQNKALFILTHSSWSRLNLNVVVYTERFIKYK